MDANNSRTPVRVSIHRRTDREGYVVRVTVGEGADQKIARYPVASMPAAEELAASIRDSLQAGLPVDIWMSEIG